MAALWRWQRRGAGFVDIKVYKAGLVTKSWRQPLPQTLLAWIHIVDSKILSTRTKGKTKYYIPGGKRESGETDAQALVREIKEELTVDIELSTLHLIGIFEAQADGHKPGVLVRMTCYSANYFGELKADSEIQEMVWLNYADIDKVAEVDVLIFEFLHKNGLLI